jgi:hypothetical protein
MKPLTGILIFISIASFACSKSLIPDDPKHDSISLDSVVLDTFIKNNYSRDAKLLYCLEIVHDSTHFNRNNPVIDTSEVSEILKIIQAVYDLNTEESRIVFDTYKIHSRICLAFNNIYLKVQTDQPAIVNLSKEIIPTGNQQLDAILGTYGFDSVRTFNGYPGFPWLTIYSKNEYNLLPIVSMFRKIPSILLTDWEEGSCIGDGSTISLTRFKDSAKIIFGIGNGDCPAGCIYHKYWEFEVKESKATFIRTFEN